MNSILGWVIMALFVVMMLMAGRLFYITHNFVP